MRSGLLRQRVIVQRREDGTRDEFGQPTPVEFLEIGTFWAEVRPLSGKELFEARQVSPRLSIAVALRGRIDVRPNDRITFGERVLEIVSVADRDERRREQMLSCQEVVT